MLWKPGRALQSLPINGVGRGARGSWEAGTGVVVTNALHRRGEHTRQHAEDTSRRNRWYSPLDCNHMYISKAGIYIFFKKIASGKKEIRKRVEKWGQRPRIHFSMLQLNLWKTSICIVYTLALKYTNGTFKIGAKYTIKITSSKL